MNKHPWVDGAKVKVKMAYGMFVRVPDVSIVQKVQRHFTTEANTLELYFTSEGRNQRYMVYIR